MNSLETNSNSFLYVQIPRFSDFVAVVQCRAQIHRVVFICMGARRMRCVSYDMVPTGLGSAV